MTILSPLDAQLVAALLPRTTLLRDQMVATITALARSDKLTEQALWKFAGGLVVLADLEARIKGELRQAEKDFSA